MTPAHPHRVLSSTEVYRGRVITLRRDEVSMPGGTTAMREVVEHPGAVGIVALDDEDRVLLVTQYRHPVGRRVTEIPAGLLDVEGESPLEAARRELAEEGGLAADRWEVLVDALTTPGMSDEAIRVYLARGLRQVTRSVQEHEEVDLTAEWLPLDEAVRGVLAGDITNAMACVGLLAARSVRDGAPSRPSDAPWADRRPVGTP